MKAKLEKGIIMSNSDIDYIKDQMDEYLFERQGELVEELVKLISSQDNIEEELENDLDFEDEIVDLALKIAQIHDARGIINPIK